MSASIGHVVPVPSPPVPRPGPSPRTAAPNPSGPRPSPSPSTAAPSLNPEPSIQHVQVADNPQSDSQLAQVLPSHIMDMVETDSLVQTLTMKQMQ